MSFLVEQLFGSPLMVAPVSPPLDGRVVVITGSNTGLGLQTAIHLANLNPSKLIMAVRTISKGQEAERKVRESVPGFKGDIEVWQLDLGTFNVQPLYRIIMTDLSSRKYFSDELIHLEQRVSNPSLRSVIASIRHWTDWIFSARTPQ